MAAKKEETKQSSDKVMMSAFLNERKDDHFNFLQYRYWKISTGSLLLDSVVGPVTPGLHRLFGKESGGKTSESLEIMRNFLNDVPKSKGVYIGSEGRLASTLKERTGLKFVTNPEEWDFGTILVIETNVYEAVADLIQRLVYWQGEEYYGIIVDSVDGLNLKADLEKGYDDSAKVAGGPVIASVLMKRIAIPLAKRGHFAIFISQVRSDIKLDPYTQTVVRQISATGGNALLHYSNIMLEFQPRFKDDMIMSKGKEKEPPSLSNPPLGHWAKVIVKKSGTETQNFHIKYPIKFGIKGGSSIWVSREIIDSLLQWELIEKSGAWYSFSADLINDIPELPADKFQGLDSIFEYVDSNETLRLKLFKYLKDMIQVKS